LISNEESIVSLRQCGKKWEQSECISTHSVATREMHTFTGTLLRCRLEFPIGNSNSQLSGKTH
jgi:hypothetical protein